MKKIIFAVLFVFIFAASVFADVLTLNNFTIDLPAGWTNSVNANGVNTFTAPSGDSVAVIIEDNQGLPLLQAAQNVYNARNGTGPITEEGDGCRFRNLNAQGNGFDWYVFLVGDKTFSLRMSVFSEELLAVGKTARPR